VSLARFIVPRLIAAIVIYVDPKRFRLEAPLLTT
jgi:hypothetical protein